jgi:O-antigen/teichoic acid export membrane protein
MAKLAALVSYAYQALLAFGSLLIIARVLGAAEYSIYSIFIATTQLAAIGSFEWIRFACSRFYPGVDQDAERAQRGTMFREFLLSLGVCAAIIFLAAVVGVLSLQLAILGLLVIVLQGWTDLHLTMLRFRDEMAAFSWLQGLRATSVALGAVVGALALNSAVGAMYGITVGYICVTLLAFANARREPRLPGIWNTSVARMHLQYGSASAVASVIGLTAPLGLRFVLQGAFGVAAAGPLLAIDLCQRPFVLVLSAVQGIQYPALVRAYDGKEASFGATCGSYYALLVTLALLAGGAVAAILPLLANWMVPTDMQAAFMGTSAALLVVFLLRAITQNVFTTPAHLTRDLKAITVLAAADAALLIGPAAVVAFWANGAMEIVCLAGAMGSATYAALGFSTLRRLPCRPWIRPAAVAAVAVLACLVVSSWTWTVVGALWSMAIGSVLGVAALWSLYADTRSTPNNGV